MRISDWSSDVCSSDLSIVGAELRIAEAAPGAIEHEAVVLPLADQIECAVHRFPLGPVGLHDEHDLSHEGCKHHRSEEHTSELQSLMRISYAVFCLKKKTTHTKDN